MFATFFCACMVLSLFVLFPCFFLTPRGFEKILDLRSLSDDLTWDHSPLPPRPDMTFAVDWALNNNYLSIYPLPPKFTRTLDQIWTPWSYHCVNIDRLHSLLTVRFLTSAFNSINGNPLSRLRNHPTGLARLTTSQLEDTWWRDVMHVKGRQLVDDSDEDGDASLHQILSEDIKRDDGRTLPSGSHRT